MCVGLCRSVSVCECLFSILVFSIWAPFVCFFTFVGKKKKKGEGEGEGEDLFFGFSSFGC